MSEAGPCIICGATDYPLSVGGPTICPSCDCGDFGMAKVQRQAAEIARLRDADKRNIQIIKEQIAEIKRLRAATVEDLAKIAGIAVTNARMQALEEAVEVAKRVGNFGDYQRHELTADYGQPKYDMMNDIIVAILALIVQPAPSQRLNDRGVVAVEHPTEIALVQTPGGEPAVEVDGGDRVKAGDDSLG